MSQPWTHTAGAAAYPRVNEHYVEPHWCSVRLFEEEQFVPGIYDPACGFGRIIMSAINARLDGYGCDIADREPFRIPIPEDFLEHKGTHNNIVSNPPFDIFMDFAEHALTRARYKVALIMPTARLNAARWLRFKPLRRVWLMTPRPSMPPGHLITAKGRISGGKSDYCWIVFEHGYKGDPELKWLVRDDAP